ncbi:hypothetical protein BT63DRAFT_440007 [Microthyrium microscopicum]|uniref:DUF6589 domain-containing protein n=1 Tax=Microthyrium microscopicum TaxID=703497 RepID=A0A6A6UCF2_9PEZI|nr:hypothetical protein BT63DRAFT_440007 [Microthyrium microscopicum]
MPPIRSTRRGGGSHRDNPISTQTRRTSLRQQQQQSNTTTTTDPANTSSRIQHEPNNAEPSGPSQPAATTTPRQSPNSAKKKLTVILKCIRDQKMSMRSFLLSWAGQKDSHSKIVLDNDKYANVIGRRTLLKDVIEQLSSDGIMPEYHTDSRLWTEFRALAKLTGFNRFSSRVDGTNIDFKKAIKKMRNTAPIWTAFLHKLMRNRDHKTYKRSDKPGWKLMYMITAIILHRRSRETNNYLAATLGVYLLGSGVKRRVMDLLAALGVCTGYKTALRHMKKVSRRALRNIRRRALNRRAVLCYDNMNFASRKRNEIVGNTASMAAVTTAIIAICPSLPPGGLTQDMHDPTKEFDWKSIQEGPLVKADGQGGEHVKTISRCLIVDALKRGIPDIIKPWIAKHKKDKHWPGMPDIDILAPHKTEFDQLGAIMENEGTTDGTYRVHDEIFLRHFGFPKPPINDAGDVASSSDITASVPSSPPNSGPDASSSSVAYSSSGRTCSGSSSVHHISSQDGSDVDMSENASPSSSGPEDNNHNNNHNNEWIDVEDDNASEFDDSEIGEASDKEGSTDIESISDTSASPNPGRGIPPVDSVPASSSSILGTVSDENSTDGSQALDPSARIFGKRLFLTHGDQLSTKINRSIKAEAFNETQPYDSRKFLHPVPGWFHIYMNYFFHIVRTHWDSSEVDTPAPHSIMHDVSVWGRSCRKRDNAQTHQVIPVLIQGFSSRVLALFLRSLDRKGHCPGRVDDSFFAVPELLKSCINRLSMEQFDEIIEDVRQTAFTREAWDGRPDGSDDIEFRTMCRYLQEIELLLTMRYALRYGDIGLLRLLVDPLTIHFYGTGQNNYGDEMLWLRWNLSDVNTPELQRSILASSLVNWEGRKNSFKPMDLGLEHLNGNCSRDMKSFGNSTHDVEATFNRVCLCNTYMRHLQDAFARAFVRKASNKHTNASAEHDIFLLCQNLIKDGLAESRPQSAIENYGPYYDSPDVKRIGLDKLDIKAESFNRKTTIRQDHMGNNITTRPIDILDQDVDSNDLDVREEVAMEETMGDVLFDGDDPGAFEAMEVDL